MSSGGSTVTSSTVAEVNVWNTCKSLENSKPKWNTDDQIGNTDLKSANHWPFIQTL